YCHLNNYKQKKTKSHVYDFVLSDYSLSTWFLFNFCSYASITAATAPSPVTLVAVPKLSCATYKAIMKATAASLKPRLVISTPLAAIIAPPGTPGAAIITTPSSKITTSISQRPGIS